MRILIYMRKMFNPKTINHVQCKCSPAKATELYKKGVLSYKEAIMLGMNPINTIDQFKRK